MSIESGPKKERVTESFDREALEASVHRAAVALSEDTIKLLVGDDEWEVQEFDAKIEASMYHRKRDEAALTRMRDILVEIKSLETSADADKEERIKKLGEEFTTL